MDVSALSNSLAAQSLMGQLIIKVLGTTTELAQQQASAAMEAKIQDGAMEPVVELIEGLGENMDVVA